MSRRAVNPEIKQERKNAVIKALKGLIFPAICTAIVIILVYAVIHLQEPVPEEEIIIPNAYEGTTDPIIIENDKLQLTMDPVTTQIQVLVKSSGKVWYSNPQDVAADPMALGTEKQRLMSTLIMSYSVDTGQETEYNNYGFGIENGVYELETTNDSITVHYSIGNIEKQFTIPPIVTEEEFRAWCDKMSDKGKDLVQSYYKKYDINKLNKKDAESKDEMLERYPLFADHVIYILRDTTKEATKKTMEEYFAEAGYTYEDYMRDSENDLGGGGTNRAIFNVTMTYRLEGENLIVEVPFKELECKSEYNIYTITPLPYFGAGNKTANGFMFVPEGGGALINFNNGKTSQNAYAANVYGWDMCLKRSAIVHNTHAYFNTFGISEDNDSFLCMLEDGASYAMISADIAGKTNSYNYVNAKFSITQREQYDVGAIADTDVFEYVPELPDEKLVERFTFVDSGSYVDMAKAYQQYLMKTYPGALEKLDDTSAPAVIEIVGAIDKTRQVVGFPMKLPLALTTFDEAQEIISDLNASGMKNMSAKLIGWCNGGVDQKILTKTHVLSSLGGKKDLKALSNKAAELGVDLYLNGVTQYAYNSNLLNGFFSYTDAAKLISKERCELFVYSAVTYAEREGTDRYFLLHTELANKMIDKLVKAADNYNAGVSFEDLGIDLSADYYRKNMYSREAVRKLQTEKLQDMKANGKNVMINMGNDYAAVYSDMITNMDLSGSQYTILDVEVPFFQLATHGYLNYTGEPLNICGDLQDELLYSAEYGAGLQFTLMDEEAFTLQDTLYTRFYGCDYNAWAQDVKDIYNRYNSELGHVFNQEMTGHAKVDSKVSCTTYADGTDVYVNYRYQDYTTEDGIVIPARDYVVVR